MKRERTRLDVRLVELGLAPSRERAQALILAGNVVVGDHVATKAGQPIDASAVVRLKGEVMPWVSRGGLKLVHALDHFAIDVAGANCLDAGASTGGFTDVLLTRGARAVIAVDVGYGQLAWSLQKDPRVTLMERTNLRTLDVVALPFSPEIVVCDVSFISLTLVLPKLVEAATRGTFSRRGPRMVCLVKPQFEVGKGEVGKGGVVRDEGQRLACVEKCKAAAIALGCGVHGVVPSPITGPAGNVEYLLALTLEAA